MSLLQQKVVMLVLNLLQKILPKCVFRLQYTKLHSGTKEGILAQVDFFIYVKESSLHFLVRKKKGAICTSVEICWPCASLPLKGLFPTHLLLQIRQSKLKESKRRAPVLAKPVHKKFVGPSSCAGGVKFTGWYSVCLPVCLYVQSS